MASAATKALESGLAAHLSVGGEILTIRHKMVRCLVNYAVPDNDHPNRPNFTLRNGADIMIPIASIQPAPKPGEILRDTCGKEFRIRTVQSAGIYYQMRCDVKS